ncbi:unnamed protein product [Anisakis simplex]|uniref:C2H2-type domain-containing protein n=1 Tax=Anisakis simplex TaxID=6269 RepID=A0A0M3JU87_ANISI|nr:unnamed protein product [Anisakis simplex]
MALPSVKHVNTANDILGLPNFAIVRIPEGGDIIKLFSLLLNNGFPEVSFVNEIRENAFLPAVASMRELNELMNGNANLTEEDALAAVQDTNSVLLATAPNNAEHSPAPSSSTPVHCLASASSTGNIPSPIPFVARPRGSRAVTVDDPNLYAVCQLCQNKIMASRLSNLTNHVRRHASLKQFQCIYCVYTHNEMAKVRLHMQHNHKDHLSQPLDALSPEMQSQWDLLMEQCFPGYSKNCVEGTGIAERSSESVCDESERFTCIECGLRVSLDSLRSHLNTVHRLECIPYSCEECGYQNADQWRVRLHITLKHSEKAAEVNVEALEAGSNLDVFLHKYFPEIPADEEEARMLSQFQNLAPKEERCSISPISREDVSSREIEIIENDDTSSIRCEICHKQMPNNRSLSSLMNHAKRHYHVKQYQCSECSYTSSEAAHVRTHMALKHPQSAWIEIMRKCFPALVSRIDQFRFKHSTSEDHEKDPISEHHAEQNTNNRAANSVHGKRKSALRVMIVSFLQLERYRIS